MTMTQTKTTLATISPGLQYRDAPKAIDWLCKAFGFKRHAVYEDGNLIAHAELSYGNGMVMLGSYTDRPANVDIRHPDQIGRKVTHYINVIVADADAHYAQAKKMGAEIVQDIEDKNYGGRGYTCRDLEGYLWSFGSYNPWDTKQ
jgi:uncharacterized glyoxalase superfamily protein PhnB